MKPLKNEKNYYVGQQNEIMKQEERLIETLKQKIKKDSNKGKI